MSVTTEMVAEAEKVRGSLFEERPETDRSGQPSWFREGADRAWEVFRGLSMPKRTDEDWRFANLKQLDLERYRAAESVDAATEADLLARSEILEKTAGRLVFANDDLIASEVPEVPGLTVLSFEEALRSHSDLLEKHFMSRLPELGSEKFAAWHRAVMSNGVFVHADRGVQVDLPIEVTYWLSGKDVAVFPHTLILAEEGSKVHVVSHHLSADRETDAGLTVGVSDVVVGRNAEVSLIKTQNCSRRSKQIQMTTTTVHRDGRAKAFVLNLGSSWVRSETATHLIESGGRSDLLSASVLRRDQEVDQRTLQHHAAPHTESDLLFKNALFEKSRSIFSGLIKVDDEAHYTDAYQTCRNLLGSDDAESNSMPGLEINADQVKCSHGATSSPVESEELFYLLARGIPDATARELVTFGFTKEAVERIGDEAIEAMIIRLVEEKFQALRF